jgi:hypothetical protein
MIPSNQKKSFYLYILDYKGDAPFSNFSFSNLFLGAAAVAFIGNYRHIVESTH